MIAAELNTSTKRGGYKIPILYVANNDSTLVNRFGVNGLYTKYSDRIENVYNKTNEPLFSTVEMITKNGEILKIKGTKIIDNADMFKRAPLPTYLKWILPMLRFGSKMSSIDPYYTRFDSDLEVVINDSVSRGFGVLEIMDLK